MRKSVSLCIVALLAIVGVMGAQAQPAHASSYNGNTLISRKLAYAATSIGVRTPYGYFPADGKDHTFTKTFPCRFAGECHVIYHIKAIHTKIPIGTRSPSTVAPMDPIGSYSPSYIYTYNSYDVWGGDGELEP